MGFSPVGFLGLFLTQTAGFHGYIFQFPGCMAVKARVLLVFVPYYPTPTVRL